MSEMYPNADDACDSCLKERDAAVIELKAALSIVKDREDEIAKLRETIVTREHHKLVCETWAGRENAVIRERDESYRSLVAAREIAKQRAGELAVAEALIERLKLRAYEPLVKPTWLELGVRLWSNEIKRQGARVATAFEAGRRAGERTRDAIVSIGRGACRLPRPVIALLTCLASIFATGMAMTWDNKAPATVALPPATPLPIVMGRGSAWAYVLSTAPPGVGSWVRFDDGPWRRTWDEASVAPVESKTWR